jgi:hypothetical protein
MFVVAVLGVVLASAISIKPQGIVVALQDAQQWVMTLDPGYSSFLGLTGTNKASALRKVTALTRAAPRILSYKLGEKSGSPAPERIDIDIKFAELRKIQSDRRKAIENGILINPTPVKGRIGFRGKSMRATIRLKGDLHDHWDSRYRMSFRINMKGDHSVLSFKKFSIHKPISRAHPYDQTFQALMRKAGNLTSAHDYARVYMNGEYWGIMHVEEHMSAVLLEKQRVSDSLIFEFGGEESWLYRREASEPHPHYRLSDRVLNARVFDDDKYLADAIRRRHYSYVVSQRLNTTDASLYDVDSYSRAMIGAAAWAYNFTHVLDDSNCRHYFNPYTLQLEPVTTDQVPFMPIDQDFGRVNAFEANPIYGVLSRTDAFWSHLDQNMQSVADAFAESDQVVAHYQSYFPVDEPLTGEVIRRNLGVIKSDPKRYLQDQNANENVIIPKAFQSTKEQASGLPKHVHARHFQDGSIEFFNLLPEAVNVLAVFADGTNVLPGPIEIPGYTPGRYEAVTFQSSLTGLKDGAIKVKTEFLGNERLTNVGPTLMKMGLHNPMDVRLPNDTQFLKRVNAGAWRIEPGEWRVNQSTTIPGDLEISDGVRLEMAPNTYIIVVGALTAIGSPDNRIILQSEEGYWKGLYVLNQSSHPSVLRYVDVRRTSGISEGVLAIDAGAAFYGSSVDMRNVTFVQTDAPHALALVQTHYDITNIDVTETAQNGVVFRRAHGDIEGVNFNEIVLDGLIVSGGMANISGLTAGEVGGVSVVADKDARITNNRSILGEAAGQKRYGHSGGLDDAQQAINEVVGRKIARSAAKPTSAK